jgi:uncharacterized protein YggE
VKRIALLLALAFGPSLSLDQSAAQTSDARRINVLGRATTEAAPDYATVTVGVSTRAASPTAALDRNSAVAREVIAFSTRFGIEPRDIQTTSVQVRDVGEVTSPQQRRPVDAERFEASNTVSVRIRNLSRFGEYMRAAVEAGSNRISNVTFGLSNADQVANDVRAAAVEDAWRKAKRLAEAAGVKLGQVQRIDYPPRASYNGVAGEADLPTRRLSVGNVPTKVGVLEITAEVDVTWSLE